MILAGDVGGTNTRLALFDQKGGRLSIGREHVFPSREHKSLDEIVSIFLGNEPSAATIACFGIAGPVLNGRAVASNLAWVVDAGQLSRHSAIGPVWLINDLEAHAYGIGDLESADMGTLNEGKPADGNAPLIPPANRLGEAGQ